MVFPTRFVVNQIQSHSMEQDLINSIFCISYYCFYQKFFLTKIIFIQRHVVFGSRRDNEGI